MPCPEEPLVPDGVWALCCMHWELLTFIPVILLPERTRRPLEAGRGVQRLQQGFEVAWETGMDVLSCTIRPGLGAACS